MDLLIISALIAVAIGTYTDIKTLEVPDWLNYSLIATGIGGNIILSVQNNSFIHILHSLAGLVIAMIIGSVMYLSGQWGGGDSKMIFGLGAVLGLSWPLQDSFFIKFLINTLFAGAAYGLIWITILGIKNYRKVAININKHYKNTAKLRILSGIAALAAMLSVLVLTIDVKIKMVFWFAIILLYSTVYLLVIVKTVEEVSMIRLVPVEKLTEGDWIVKDVIIDKKRITGPKDLGISKKQIKELLELKEKGKIQKILVKYGMPFVPSFLIALIFTILTNSSIL